MSSINNMNNDTTVGSGIAHTTILTLTPVIDPPNSIPFPSLHPQSENETMDTVAANRSGTTTPIIAFPPLHSPIHTGSLRRPSFANIGSPIRRPSLASANNLPYETSPTISGHSHSHRPSLSVSPDSLAQLSRSPRPEPMGSPSAASGSFGHLPQSAIEFEQQQQAQIHSPSGTLSRPGSASIGHDNPPMGLFAPRRNSVRRVSLSVTDLGLAAGTGLGGVEVVSVLNDEEDESGLDMIDNLTRGHSLDELAASANLLSQSGLGGSSTNLMDTELNSFASVGSDPASLILSGGAISMVSNDTRVDLSPTITSSCIPGSSTPLRQSPTNSTGATANLSNTPSITSSLNSPLMTSSPNVSTSAAVNPSSSHSPSPIIIPGVPTVAVNSLALSSPKNTQPILFRTSNDEQELLRAYPFVLNLDEEEEIDEEGKETSVAVKGASVSSPTVSPTAANSPPTTPMLSPSSMQRRREAEQAATKRPSISSTTTTPLASAATTSVTPTKLNQPVLEEDVGELFSTGVSWADASDHIEVCHAHLAQSLVVCIGDMAHSSNTPTHGQSSLQKRIQQSWQTMTEISEAITREKKRQEQRENAQDSGHNITRRASVISIPPPPINTSASSGNATTASKSPPIMKEKRSKSISIDHHDRLDHRSSSPTPSRSSSNSSPAPAQVDEEENDHSLPIKSKEALQQACQLLTQIGADPERKQPELAQALLDVLHHLLQRQKPLSLCFGLSQPNASVEACWYPIWNWLLQFALDDTRERVIRSQALDALFLIGLARGSVYILYHVINAALQTIAANLTVPTASLSLLVDYARTHSTIPVDENEVRTLNLQLSSSPQVPSSTAAVIIAAQLDLLTFSSSPLYEEHLNQFNLSACNPNNQGVIYRSLCIDTTETSLKYLFQLFQDIFNRLESFREVIDSKGEDTEHELTSNVTVCASILRIMQVHFHQLALQNPQPTEDEQAIYQPFFKPLRSLLNYHTSTSPILAVLGSPAANCLVFGAPFLFTNLGAQVQEATRLLSAAAKAWRDPTIHYITTSSLIYTRLLLKRLNGFFIAHMMTDVLFDSDSTLHLNGLTKPIVEKFVSYLIVTVESAAATTLTTTKDARSHLHSHPTQLALFHCLMETLECLQQQIVCTEATRVQAEDQQHKLNTESLEVTAAISTTLTKKTKPDESKSPVSAHKEDDEETKEEQKGDEFSSPSAPVLAYPPTLPTNSSLLAQPQTSYFIRYAPLVLASMDRLTTRASQYLSQTTNVKHDANASPNLFLQLLRVIGQPLIMISCQLVSPTRPEFSIAILPSLTTLVEQLARLAPNIHEFLSDTPPSNDSITIKQAFQSSHPYRPFSDKEIVLTLPLIDQHQEYPLDAFKHPPTEVKITFDPACATHTKYDYVELFSLQSSGKDARGISESFANSIDKKPPAGSVLRGTSISDRFHGARILRHANWPKETLTFKDQHVLLHFSTVATTRPAVAAEENSSYYGFRVNVECTYRITSHRQPHRIPAWYSYTLQASAWLAANSSAALIKSLPSSEEETKSYQWLHNYLFSGGLEKPILNQLKSASTKGTDSSSQPTPNDPTSPLAASPHPRTTPTHASSTGLTLPITSPDDMHQSFLDHLCMAESQRSQSTHIAATYVENLLVRLVASGVDRQIIQKSVTVAANQLTSALFAVMIKHYGRTNDAMNAGATDATDQPLDPILTRLWKKAAEIKMDIRTQQSISQDVRELSATLFQRIAFLQTLSTPGVDFDSKDGGQFGLNAPDLLRRQNSLGSIVGREYGSTIRPRGESDASSSHLPSQSRPTLTKVNSMWSKSKIMSKLLRHTVRSMKVLKNLLRIRTRSSDDSGEEDALARSILSFVRKGETETMLAAIYTQHRRATHRLTGLQAVHLLAKRLLALHTESCSTLRTGDTGRALAELCLSQVSRALRAPVGSIVPQENILASASVGHTILDSSATPPPAPSHVVPMHILSSIESIGIEMRSFIFNEYYAFIGSFLELAANNGTTDTSSTTSSASSIVSSPTNHAAASSTHQIGLSSPAQLHLLHLCAVNFEFDKTGPLIPVSSSTLNDPTRVPSLTRSHDMFALSRLGIFRFLRPLTAVLKPTYTSVDHFANTLTDTSSSNDSSTWNLEPTQTPRLSLSVQRQPSLGPVVPNPTVGRASDLPWNVGYAAWCLFRLLAYSSAPVAFPGSNDVDSGAIEISSGIFDELRGQLESNIELESHLIGDDGSVSGPISIGDASIAWHLHALIHPSTPLPILSTTTAIPTLTSLPSSSLGSAFSPRKSIIITATPTTNHSRAELLAHRIELLWILARCAQSSSCALRLASSNEWVRILLHLSSPLTTQSPKVLKDLHDGILISRLLALQIIRNVLPLVSPHSIAFMDINATNSQSNSIESDATAISLPVSSSSLNSNLTPVPHATTFLTSLFDRIGENSLSLCGGVHVDSKLMNEANQFIWLIRTLLACPTITTPTPVPSSAMSPPNEPLFSPNPSLPTQPTHDVESLKQVPLDWKELIHSILSTNFTRLGELKLSKLQDASNLSLIRSIFASLRVLGGGQSTLSEGSKVKLELKEQQRTGVIIRTVQGLVNTNETDERQEKISLQITVSGLSTEDVLYEVALDPVLADTNASHHHSDDTDSFRSHATASIGSTTSDDGDAWQTKDVYLMYSSTLIPVETVPVPLAALHLDTAQIIIHSIGLLLRTIENEQPLALPSNSAVSPPLSSSSLSPIAFNLLWSELKQECLKVLNILLERDEISSLVLQQGLGPLLVPIALEEVQLTEKKTPAGENNTSNKEGVSGSTSTDADDRSSAPQLSITELELRINELHRCLDTRHNETVPQILQRQARWEAVDAKQQAELAAKAKAEEDKRKAEIARLPPLTITYPDHPHILHFTASVYNGNYDCDVCHRTRSGNVYHCTPCRYDLCPACAAPSVAIANAASTPAPTTVTSTAGVTSSTLTTPSEQVKPLDVSLSVGNSEPSSLGTTATVTVANAPVQQQFKLLGLSDSAALDAISQSSTDPLTRILDSFDQPTYSPELDQLARGDLPNASSMDSWTLFPGGYTVSTPRLPEGWQRVRAFMLAYTESSIGREGDVDSYGRHTGQLHSDHDFLAIDSPKDRDKKKSTKNSLKERNKRKNYKDFNYNYVRMDHDPFAHKQDYGKWKESLLVSIARQEEDALYRTTIAHSNALSILYARRSVLTLLHILKDQLGSTSPSNTSRQLPKLNSPTTADSDTLPPLPVASSSRVAAAAPPPFLRRTASVAHALSSFGPAGFIARFIALLCSAPHQLATSLGGDARRTGFNKLSGVVGTILLAEKHHVATEWNRNGIPITADQFKRHAPIARHLMQGAITNMISLCQRTQSRMDSGTRHSTIQTIEYIFDAFFALEDHHHTSSSNTSRSRPSTSSQSPRPSVDESDSTAMMLLSLFTVPVCLVILEVISSACFSLSPSGESSIATSAAGLTDDNPAHVELVAVYERQRLFFVRLLGRILTIRMRFCQSSSHIIRAIHASPVNTQWTTLLHMRCNALQTFVLGALEDETVSGRGTMTSTSFPLSFFLQALMDLVLIWNRYTTIWNTLGIELPMPIPIVVEEAKKVEPEPTVVVELAAVSKSPATTSTASTSTTVEPSTQSSVSNDTTTTATSAPVEPTAVQAPTVVADVTSTSVSASAVNSASTEVVTPSQATPSESTATANAPTNPSTTTATTETITVDATQAASSTGSAAAPAAANDSDSSDEEFDIPVSTAADRAAWEADRRQKKNKWLRQLIMLDSVLTILRSRPRAAAVSKMSVSSPSPSATPSPMTSPTGATKSAANSRQPSISTSPLSVLVSEETNNIGSTTMLAPPALSSPSTNTNLLSPPATRSANSTPRHSVSGEMDSAFLFGRSSSTSTTSQSLGIPPDFLDLFWPKTQKAMIELQRKERAAEKKKAAREEAEKLLQAERDAELNPVVTSTAEWECPVCTYTNAASLPACEMCATVRPDMKKLNNDTQIYAEITILSCGAKGTIGLGLVCHDYPTDSMPGWEEGGYGYHGDDGKIFSPPVQGGSYGPTYTTGDVIGVGYYPFKRQIFFTKNGTYLGVAFTDVPPMDYHIAVGFHSPGESIKLNVGHKPFSYKEISAKHIKRPDLHWGIPLDACRIDGAGMLEASWDSESCGLIISNAPVMIASKPSPIHSDELCYYEITIPATAAPPPKLTCTLGLTPKHYDLDRQPGWEANSYGLHGDNGCLYSADGSFLREFCDVFAPGDVAGCGYDRKKHEIFFTLNGRHLGVAFSHVPEMSYHAAIGLFIPGEAASVNFGTKPFKYELMNQAQSPPTTASSSSSASAGSGGMIFLSPRDNVLDRHAECVKLGADRLSAVLVALEETVGLVQSKEPIVVTSDNDVESTEAIDFSALLPADDWRTVDGLFGPVEDEELVALLNRRAEKMNSTVNSSSAGADPSTSPLTFDPAAFQMTPEERVTHAVLNNIVEKSSLSLGVNSPIVVGSSILNPHNTNFIFGMRVAFLQQVNELLNLGIALTNLSKPARRSLLSRHFRDSHIRAIFFSSIKRWLIRQTLTQTSVQQDVNRPFMLRLDLFKSQKLLLQSRTDLTGTKTTFGQAFQQLHLHRHEEENKYGDHDRDPTRFLVKYRQRAWKTVFKGMFADDYGGLYRDALDRMCHELQSSILPLFILCPNAREQIGQNRNHYVPNPAATAPIELSMFEFLGKLLGLAMRSGELLTLDFPSIVWKALVDDPITEEDVMAIDRLSFKMLHELRKLEGHINSGSITADEFQEYLDSNFVVVGSDTKQHELVPGGEHIPVTWTNKDEFVASLLSYRKHEFRVQCQAIRHGLSQVVPIAMLSILTWQELRNLICGSGKIDLALLKQLTIYEGCSDRDPHIQNFWKVMTNKFDEAERAAFIQFVWGRSRLASTAAEFERKFKIQLLHPKSGSRPDDYLPVAHTCFMSVELPAYSSLGVLHRKLLYAINNCVAIDVDSTDQAQAAGRMTGSLESDEEED